MGRCGAQEDSQPQAAVLDHCPTTWDLLVLLPDPSPDCTHAHTRCPCSHLSHGPGVVLTFSMFAHWACPSGRLFPSSLSYLGSRLCMTWASVRACTHFTDGFPEALSWIVLFPGPMGDNNLFGGTWSNIFQGNPSRGWEGGRHTMFRYFRCVPNSAGCSCPTWWPVASQLMWSAPSSPSEPSKHPLSTTLSGAGGESPAISSNQKPQWRSLLWSPQQWVAVKIVLGFSWSHGAGGGRCPLLEESPATCCQEPWLGEASAAPGRRAAAAQMETRSAPRTDCLIYFKIKQMAVVGFV